MIENNNGTSQFLKDCNTDWNLNHEFICWLNYWLKEYKKKAEIDLTFHKFMYKSRQWTQEEIIDRLIELTSKVNNDFYEFERAKEKEVQKMVDEIFYLFHLVFWAMWW